MKPQNGFTLLELAIVLVIVTILIGGLAVPLSAQIQARRIAETQKTLAEAREAIMGYAMSHTITGSCTCSYKADTTLDPVASSCPLPLCPATGTAALTLPITRHYLPCPDLSDTDPEPNQDNDGLDGLTDLNNGVEDRLHASPSCAASSGNLPWVTLGTAAQDAWGNRLRYGVTLPFANKLTGFSNTDNGTLQVCSANGCTTVDVASNVPAVLVSHGPNGWGARNVNGSKLADPLSLDEKENTSADVNFVSRAPTNADSTSGEFDDLVVWISQSLLIGRVCPAGGCP